MKIILSFSPHTDDSEFGASGLLLKCIEKGFTAFVYAFSAPHQNLEAEMRAACKILGVTPLFSCNTYLTRHFAGARQLILEEMFQISKELNPDIVLAPSLADTHQDHEVISKEAFRAFKRKCVLGYEMPYNNLDFNANYFVELSEGQLQKKIAALNCYKTQYGRITDTADFVRSLAVVRGAQIGVKYAEAFNVTRWIT